MNQKLLLTSLLAFISLSAASAVAAWSSNAVAVIGVETDYISSASKLYVHFGTAPNGKPSCASGTEAVVSGNAEHVRNMLTVASGAFLSGKTVRVNWTGSCEGSGSIGIISGLKIQ